MKLDITIIRLPLISGGLVFKVLLSNEDYELCTKNLESSYYTQCLKDIQNKEKIVSEENNGNIL